MSFRRANASTLLSDGVLYVANASAIYWVNGHAQGKVRSPFCLSSCLPFFCLPLMRAYAIFCAAAYAGFADADTLLRRCA